MKLIIVSGTSGSGKSIVLQTLEDLGYYCIDNLPLGLLSGLARELDQSRGSSYDKAAIGLDVRNLTNDFSQFPDALKRLQEAGIDCDTLFLDADDSALLKRFSETRRRHPLTHDDTPLAEAIEQERAHLQPIATRADRHIDTSRTNIHQLRDLVRGLLEADRKGRMTVMFESFGFKHGIPIDADYVFDLRCLPNPHWEPELRALTGRDPAVRDFLEGQADVEQMFEQICGFLNAWLPKFEADNRSYMTIAVGCTGGQHRSVYFSERLAQHFSNGPAQAQVRHRELA